MSRKHFYYGSTTSTDFAYAINELDGINKYVDSGFRATGLTAMTFACYLKMRTLGVRQDIFSTTDAALTAINFFVNSSNVLQVFHRNGGANPGFLTGVGTFNTTTWKRVVITLANNGTNNNYTFYIDGAVDKATTAYGQGQTIARGNNFFIGAMNSFLGIGGFANFANVRLDEIMICNKALSAAEVTTDWNAGVSFDRRTSSFAANIIRYPRISADDRNVTFPTIKDYVNVSDMTAINMANSDIKNTDLPA